MGKQEALRQFEVSFEEKKSIQRTDELLNALWLDEHVVVADKETRWRLLESTPSPTGKPLFRGDSSKVTCWPFPMLLDLFSLLNNTRFAIAS